jgi:hypothetical protein
MTDKLRRALVLTAATLLATATGAFAGSVRLGPVKGATYAGIVHDETITLKVSSNGKTAKVGLGSAPGFCQGGAGPELESSKAGAISKHGALTAKIAYSSAQTHKQFATVTVKGSFETFSGSKPVFQGTVKSVFSAAASCDGQESFQATASKSF